MWSEGTIQIKTDDAKNKLVHYWCKHFVEPNEKYGLDGGKISKLMLKQDDMVVYNYDRGADIKPQTKEAEQALAILLSEYN